MRSNTPYKYLNKAGQVEEVYSPSNPPQADIIPTPGGTITTPGCYAVLIKDATGEYTSVVLSIEDLSYDIKTYGVGYLSELYTVRYYPRTHKIGVDSSIAGKDFNVTNIRRIATY